MALQYVTESKYCIICSNDNLSIPEMKDTLSMGVYRTLQDWEDSIEPIAIWNNDVTLSRWNRQISDALDYIEMDIIIEQNVQRNKSLAFADVVVVEYLLDHQNMPRQLQRELFDMKDTDWTPLSMDETLHRILGHSSYSIVRIIA